MVPAGPALVPTPLPHPFSGLLDGSLCSTVTIGGQAAAIVGSTATNQPAHLPTPPGTSFVTPPTNRATVMLGSATVTIGGQPAAPAGDTAPTGNDPAALPGGARVAGRAPGGGG